MKILYISPENTVGTLSLWKYIHERNGHICRYVTFFPSPKNYGDDICLNLPFDFTTKRMSNWRHQFYKIYRGETGYYTEKKGIPPVWAPEGSIDKLFFKMKDVTWKKKVEKTVDDFDLLNFDVYHFESGMDFFKGNECRSDCRSGYSCSNGQLCLGPEQSNFLNNRAGNSLTGDRI